MKSKSSRNIFFVLAILFFVSLFSCKSVDSHVRKNSSTKTPNIIFIYTDDQRQDAAGFNNNDVIITPAIDQMAERGLQFSNANVVFALCSPSRAALLTGRYGSANGVLHLNSKLNDGEKSLASYLKEAGYQTAVSGKWHIKQAPKKLGFDRFSYFYSNGTYYGRKIINMQDTVYPEIHCDEYCVNSSIEFINEMAEDGKPFFLFHNTQTPHMNGKLIWDAKDEILAKYNQAEMPVASNRYDDLSTKPEYLKKVRNRRQAKKYGYPDSVAIQKHTKEYYSVITEMDDALGRLFSAIEEKGLMDYTYIFFMSDNGWMLGDHGFTSKVLPYRPSTQVPMFVLGPGLQKGISDKLVLNIDAFPTILDLAGVELPENIHGESFAPLLKGEDQEFRKAFVYEGLGNYGGAKPNLTVVNNKYRFILTYEDKSLEKVIHHELYDQENDPQEMNNLYGNEKYEETSKELQVYIDNHIENILKQKLTK